MNDSIDTHQAAVIMDTFNKRRFPSLFFLIFNITILLPRQSSTQVIHNVNPIPYNELSNSDKITNGLMFLELRMRAHDYHAIHKIFDSTFEFNNVAITRDSLVNLVKRDFFYRSVDTTQLRNEYNALSKPFYPDFHVSISNLPQSFNQLVVGDTANISISIVTSWNQNPFVTTLTIRKTQHTYLLPSFDFVITRNQNGGLVESIQEYAHKWIVNYYGINSRVEQDWLSDDWYDKWDFLENAAKGCVDNLSNFNVSMKSLLQVPILVNAGGTLRSYMQVTKTESISSLGDNVIGSIDDYDVFGSQSGSSNLLFVCDRLFKRLLSGNLNLGWITATPRMYNGNSIGHEFEDVSLLSVKNQWIGVLDVGPRKYHKFQYTLSDPTSFTGGDCGPVICDSLMMIAQFEHEIPSLEYSGTFPTGMGITTQWVSGWRMDRPELSYYHANCPSLNYCNPIQRFVGIFNGKCGEQTDFCTAPLFGMSDSYTCCGSTSDYSDLLGLAYCRTFVVTDKNYELLSSNHSTPKYFNTKNVTVFDKSLHTDITMIDRMADGRFLVSDAGNNMLHVFEPYEGKYVCSYQIPGTYPRLIGARSVKNWAGSLARPFYDIYVANFWMEGSGFRRYYPGGEFLNLSRCHEGSGSTPDVLDFICTARVSYDISLIGSDSLEVPVVSNLFSDARRNQISIFNPDRALVKIKVRSDGITAFNLPSLIDNIYYIYPSGTVQKQVAPPCSHPKTVDFFVYPNPIHDRATLSFDSFTNDHVSIALFDILGRKVMDIFEGGIVPGTQYILYQPYNIPPGTYMLLLKTSRSTSSKQIILL